MGPGFEDLYRRWVEHTIEERLQRKRFYAEVERRTGVAFEDAPRCPDREKRAANSYWNVFDQVSAEMHADDPPEEDEDGNPPRTFMNDLHAMATEILVSRPVTLAGLRLQVLAMVSSWRGVWENEDAGEGPAQFIASAAAFVGVPFPPYELAPVEDEDEDEADPIFAAIERHRKAEEEFGSFMNFTDTVWYQQQVEAGRKEFPYHPGTPETKAEYARLSDLADDAAIALIDVKITTREGAAVLMAYADEFERRGNTMPDVIDFDGTERSWDECMRRSVAKVMAA